MAQYIRTTDSIDIIICTIIICVTLCFCCITICDQQVKIAEINSKSYLSEK